MLNCGELATFLRASAARVKPGLETEMKALMIEAAADAKSAIGHYQAGWPELAEATKADRLRQGYSENDPLLRSGELRDSIESRAEATFDGAEGQIGSNHDVAAPQEFGTSRIPPRPFIGPAMMHIVPKAEAEFGAFAVELLTPGVR